MYSLVIVLLSIALFATVLLAGINYIDTDYYAVKKNEHEIVSKFSNLSSSFVTYEKLKSFHLPENNWEQELKNVTNLSVKSLEDESAWSYSKDNDSFYFCLSNSQMDENIYRAISKIDNRKENAYLGANCGADETTSFTEPESFPAQAALTYWIKPQ